MQNFNHARQEEVVASLTPMQLEIYACVGTAIKTLYGTDQGFVDSVAAIGALATTLQMALEDAKADGHFSDDSK